MTYTYPQLLRELYKNGKTLHVHEKTTKELVDVKIEVKGNNFFFCKRVRPFESIYKYFLGELIWYMSGDRTVDYIGGYSIFWKKLTDKHGLLNSNYGDLVYYKKRGNWWDKKNYVSQFEWTLKQLEKDINSRQAVILYNDKDYYYEGNKDFICTQLQQFLIRDNELISIVYIRSSDVILGLTYDIPWWNLVQQQLMMTLKSSKYPDLKLGKMVINIGSVHLYSDKYQMVQAMLKKKIEIANITLRSPLPIGNQLSWYEEHVKDYLDVEPIQWEVWEK